MDNPRSLTIHNETAASHPGGAPVNPLRYAWYYPKWPFIWTSLLVASAWLVFQVSLWFLFLAVPVGLMNLLYWIRVKEHFARGDANPGIVIQVKPTLVAVATDLTHGVGVYPAVKVFRTRLGSSMGEEMQVGTRLPTVALYSGEMDRKLKHWDDFHPRPVECATGNRSALNRLMAAFAESEWARLEATIERLPGYGPGLHRFQSWPPSKPTVPLPLEQFWQIIEASKASTQDEQLAALEMELQRLSISELVAFLKRFYELKAALYDWDLWLVAFLCRGGLCSDDSFADFRNWVISQGAATYETALYNPEALLDQVSWNDASFETFGYMARQCYEQRARRELPDLDVQGSGEPTKGDWLRPELKDRSNSHMLNRCAVFKEMRDPEFDQIEQRFPKLWNYAVDNGMIKLRNGRT